MAPAAPPFPPPLWLDATAADALLPGSGGADVIAARWPLALATCEGLGLRGAALAIAAEAEVASLIEEAR